VSLGIVGVNVTIPYKEKVMEFLDEVTEEAALIGAVNTIYIKDGTLIGENTDGRGFIRSLVEMNVDPAKRKVLLIGAGGAGRACAMMLAKAGVDKIVITDKIISKAGMLVRDITSNFSNIYTEVISMDDPGFGYYVISTDLLINATPVGMKEDDGPVVDPEWLHKRMVIYDLVYNPPRTPLLKAGAKKEATCINGAYMLLYQGALSFELWTQKSPPIDEMKKALSKRLKGQWEI
jgi:shikimate dehydrogenase